ncbi:zinc-dependent metalloprotease [Chitinophaga sp. XS-30]|uniref:zinc-dependent metalloprotease n=1 Tax=Chitinophaga sp. XS-30 TaxID=2604421 RepID=UPI0011DD73CF|nr:zinc-dependent metalloprotease [Chitinophaga sp. XS-30]QEH42487.1 zinc-dependent metalloprotease [Chitinophaga sp. XS-30]
MPRFNITLFALLGLSVAANAQTAAPADSAAKKKDSLPSAIKPYEQVITAKASTHNGMFKVHQLDNRYYFEIPDSMYNRAILVVNRIARAAAGPRPQMTGYAGDQIAENVIHFEKGPADKVFMKVMRFNERSGDSTANGLYRSVINSNLEPIAAAFPVKAYNKKDSTTVIDITDYLNTENEIFHFSAQAKTVLGVGAIQADKSYIASIKTFPRNIEIRMMRTYLKLVKQGTPSTIPDSWELNSSMVLLPEVPMQPRLADARVGYFVRGYVDFDTDPQGVKEQYLITRWRLEPKAGEEEKYLRGELVEPANPIIYYIDPATPKKWVPYLIAGVNDWQQAFEQAGFRNAIKALPAPEDDSTWSIDDARHNVIVYKPSQIANASGPHVHDPRSGEIMESHINWYHNIMQLVRNWYMIQAGAIDPAARKMEFDEALMGQLIRFVSSHEVGHTLGLSHNFGASSTVPVEKLRDKAYVEAHGHTPSIMDYARFNYVAQPEDGISQKGIFPRIGEYDRWAIEWGYRWRPPFRTAKEEAAFMNKLIIDSLTSNKRLYFGSENSSADPRNQSEDLGDNAVVAAKYGIKNLQRILPQLREWTREPNEGYGKLKMMYEEVLKQYRLYTAQVLKSIGGEYYHAISVEQPGPVIEPVAWQQQKEAMQFLRDDLFATPEWLINDTLTALTGTDPILHIGVAQSNILMKLQGSGMLMGLIKTAERNKGIKTYSAAEFLEDLKQGIWGELYSGKPIDIFRRNQQKKYLDNAFKAFAAVNEIVGRNLGNGTIFYINPDPTGNDVSSIMRAHLTELRRDIRKAVSAQKGVSRYHLQDMEQRIGQVLEGKENK